MLVQLLLTITEIIWIHKHECTCVARNKSTSSNEQPLWVNILNTLNLLALLPFMNPKTHLNKNWNGKQTAGKTTTGYMKRVFFLKKAFWKHTSWQIQMLLLRLLLPCMWHRCHPYRSLQDILKKLNSWVVVTFT